MDPTQRASGSGGGILQIPGSRRSTLKKAAFTATRSSDLMVPALPDIANSGPPSRAGSDGEGILTAGHTGASKASINDIPVYMEAVKHDVPMPNQPTKLKSSDYLEPEKKLKASSHDVKLKTGGASIGNLKANTYQTEGFKDKSSHSLSAKHAKGSASLSRKASKSARSSHGSSMLASHDMLGRVISSYNNFVGCITGSAIYKFFYSTFVSTRFRIYAVSCFHIFDLAGMLVIIKLTDGSKLPSINYYNLIHAILGSLGKISLVTGLNASQLIGKEYVAKSLVKKGKGTPLSDVALMADEFVPAEGLTVRQLFIGSLFLLEGAMWYMVLMMQWTPASTDLGIFPCIPATYPVKPTLLNNVAGFLSGDASLGTIYNYGLPLADGLIGGWSAWPLFNPFSRFDVHGKGVIYAYSVICGDLEVATKPSPTPEALTFGVSYSELWSSSFTAIVSVQFPPYYHSWKEHQSEAISQQCTVEYIMGGGDVKFTFVADEWEMVTGGQMVEIQIKDKVLTQRMETPVFFGDVSKRIGSTSEHIDMTSWFAEAFHDCFNNTAFYPSQAGNITNLFQWGQKGGVYDVDRTWTALSGAIGSISHYITMQYNGSAVADCEYFGMEGSGTLEIPGSVRNVMLSAVGICLACQMMQLLRWALTSGGGKVTDRVCLILNSPLQIMYYMRASITNIIPDIKTGNHSTRSVRKHMQKILVRIGEDKRTRGEPVGTLIIAEPRMVVAMSDKRQYAQMSPSERQEVNLNKCRQLLKKVPFLKYEENDGNRQEFYDMIIDCLEEQTYPAKTYIIREGEEGRHMYFLLTGTLEVSVQGRPVATISEGSFFGEMALIAQIPRTASIMTKTPCCAYSLSASAFSSIIERFPQVSRRISIISEERMKKIEEERERHSVSSRGYGPQVPNNPLTIHYLKIFMKDEPSQQHRLSLAPAGGRRASIDPASTLKIPPLRFTDSSRKDNDDEYDDQEASVISSDQGSPRLDNRRASALKKQDIASRRSSNGSQIQESRRRLSFMVMQNSDEEEDEEAVQSSSNESRRDVPPLPTQAGLHQRAIAKFSEIPNESAESVSESEDESSDDVDTDVLRPDEKPSFAARISATLRVPTGDVAAESTTSELGKNGKSLNSIQSDVTEDGIIFDFLKLVENWKENMMASRVYQFSLWAWESTRFNIYLYTVCHILILVTIVLILKFAIGVHAPNIVYYNLIHAVAGFLGKVSFAYGLRATQLISKEFTARNLIKRGKGVSLTSIAHPVPLVKLNSDEGKTLRYLFIFALALVEVNVWYLGIAMEWFPSDSELGVFPCTPVRYTTKPVFLNDLGNYLQGNSDLAMIYSYGLPLGDGLIGGLAAWPLEIAASSFTLDHPGIGYAVNSVCGDLRVAENGTGNGLTQFRILQTEVWSTLFSAAVLVQMPAGSHNWEEHADQDIVQECMVRYIMGDADILFSFVADEWGGVIGNNLQSVVIGGMPEIERGKSADIYFGKIQDAFSKDDKHEQITRWVVEATGLVLNGTSYGASQGALFANLFQWATLPDGYYHTEITWKGMAAVMAMIAHYVLLQYDDSATSTCTYTGMSGAGDIQAPDYVVILTISAVLICLVAELSQLFWWFLLSGGGEKQDRAARLLENPMQLLYDMRAGGSEIMGEMSGEDQSSSAVKRHYEDVVVRFGESRLTRPNPVGMLILGQPGEVMAMNDKREYI
ncbi:anaphase-promoting complex subunit Hcn1 [Chytriomyces hyalinus]|nr:anaphase-promoting complex subunit Hcn1 [Chytriomyces hyalinus]